MWCLRVTTCCAESAELAGSSHSGRAGISAGTHIAVEDGISDFRLRRCIDRCNRHLGLHLECPMRCTSDRTHRRRDVDRITFALLKSIGRAQRNLLTVEASRLLLSNSAIDPVKMAVPAARR